MAGRIDVPHRAERLLVVNALGAPIDQRTLFAAERHGVALVLDEILPKLRPDGLEDEADVADDRIVAKNGVVDLQQVVHANQGQGNQHYQRQEEDPRNDCA